jgi:SAM-dependent methyltransferase
MTEAGDIAGTRAFFGSRAAGWDEKFPDDTAVFAAAVAELGLPAGAAVLDAGCGTGRALQPLRAAVGTRGTVVGLDATGDMLAEARRRGRDRLGALVLADVRSAPLRRGVLDAVFASGLLPHLSDPAAGLRELARCTRPGGRLAIFHPISRAALAARHGHAVSDDDVRAPARLTRLLADTGWTLARIDDGDGPYLAVAVRR